MASPLRSFVGQTLTWVPTATFRTRYDLIAPDNTILAALDMSSWSSKAHATTPEGTLFLRKESWTGLKIAIYADEQGPLLATYQRNWTGASGQLAFPYGRLFQWSKVNFWGTQRAWTDPTTNSVYVQFSTGAFSRRSTVTIYPQTAELPELSILVVLGLYDIIVKKREDATRASS